MVGKCPLCGTSGRVWNKEPQVFECPQCSTFFSEFGVLMDSQREIAEEWS